jgi:hypothetical protein
LAKIKETNLQSSKYRWIAALTFAAAMILLGAAKLTWGDGGAAGSVQFNSKLPMHVWVLPALGQELHGIGDTPATAPLQIPNCIVWGVRPNGESVQEVEQEAQAQSIPGLDISWMDLAAADFQHLSDVKGLQYLCLVSTKLNDADMDYLKDMKSLQYLRIDHNTDVTGTGLDKIKGLTALKYLDIRGTNLNDAGVAALCQLKSLQLLIMGETQVKTPPAYIDALKAALPGCDIHHD